MLQEEGRKEFLDTSIHHLMRSSYGWLTFWISAAEICRTVLYRGGKLQFLQERQASKVHYQHWLNIIQQQKQPTTKKFLDASENVWCKIQKLLTKMAFVDQPENLVPKPSRNPPASARVAPLKPGFMGQCFSEVIVFMLFLIWLIPIVLLRLHKFCQGHQLWYF